MRFRNAQRFLKLGNGRSGYEHQKTCPIGINFHTDRNRYYNSSRPKGRAGMGQTGWLQVVVDVPLYIHPLGLEYNLALSAVAFGIVA